MNKHFYFLLLLLFALPFSGICQTNSLEVGTMINVLDFGVLADSESDQTDAIQELIDQAAEGDTLFFPEGKYLVRTILLKSGVNILSEGILKHHSSAKVGEYSIEKQNSPNPLILGQGVKNLSISLKGESKNEGIYLLKSHQIRIYNTELTGDSTKFRAFPGIMTFQCTGIEIANTRIHHFGMPRSETDSYQPGTGIRIMSSNTISIHDSEIFKNGENGVFIHGSRKVEVINNVIRHNGMSAIQVAFGDSGKEKDYNFSYNILEENASDAIDINNRSKEKAKDIECLITENITCGNGFVKGESTPDGSGIVTLINVSNVIIYKNEAYRNNRPAIYVESCGLILGKENWADNQVEVTRDLKELLLEKNRFSSINLIANTKAQKIHLLDNELGSLSLPNGIQVDEFLIENNSFSNASFNFNLKGSMHLIGNIIENKSENPAILIVKANEAILQNNEIKSLRASAIVLRNTAKNVKIILNKVTSFNTAIFDDNSSNLLVKDNVLTSISGGPENQTFRSHYPNNLKMEGNEHIGIANSVSVLLVGKGKASVANEKITSGKANYGEVEIDE
ncbi:right-handed parallel beta-helix repeat-containing protein [Algoriphagus sp. D3-2-R+10]|uniref:right-handed parallel beta-helix repeat-containing protein n=1 Tax=Algoriphagus aurantiacus TaxID=3103948 RepID=UPI002B398BD3|nr:right-handed parallel beta-helix repeat-containing protein [Algoriphagus sp. D3-2-R+10]MEB2774820.1 right-handed parallel beta-helix repeat-containing protein [Algoriphagus sp. D3-2-R+10]